MVRKKLKVSYPAKRAYRQDCGIEFKSSMEANVYRFYKYLQKRYGKIIDVSYEAQLFKFKTNKFGIRGYIPDFKITTARGSYFIEVKGEMDATSSKKAWLLSQNYPWIKLYFIFPHNYNNIKRAYAKYIPDWE